MRILLVGAQHPVACELAVHLDELNFELGFLDVLDVERLEQQGTLDKLSVALKADKTDVVVFTLRMPLNRLSFRRRLALVDAMKKLSACIERDAKVILLSNCLVFDGSQSRAYCENDKPNPVSDEAKVWLRWENIVRKIFHQHIIVRPGWLMSKAGRYISSELKASFGAHPAPDKVPYAQGCPVAPEEISRAVVAIIRQLNCGAQVSGVFHFSTNDVYSSPQLLKHLIPETYLSVDDQVNKLNYELDCKRMLSTFGIQQRSW